MGEGEGGGGQGRRFCLPSTDKALYLDNRQYAFVTHFVGAALCGRLNLEPAEGLPYVSFVNVERSSVYA
jgi:hypothetical protein